MDALVEYFRLVLMVSIPQAFVCLGFVLAVWKLDREYPVRRLFSYAVVSSLLVDIDYYLVPVELHILNAVLISAVLLFLFYRRLGTKNLLLVLFSLYALIIMLDITTSFLTQMIYRPAPRAMIMRDYFFEAWTVFVPLYLMIYLASHLISQQRSPFFTVLYEYLIGFRKTHFRKIVLLTFFQAAGLSLLFVLWNNKPYPHTLMLANLLLYITFALTFTAFFYTLWLLVQTRDDAVRDTQDVFVEEISKMFTSIRGQRHDFLNHVQVMHTMLQMNKIDRLREYLGDFVKETHAVRDDIHYDSPALEAFVQAKTAVALSREIRFTCDVPRQLLIESSVKSVDLIKMLGNLVDNAFDEVESLPPAEREVRLQIRSVPNELEMSVHNRGRVLTREELAKVCEPGFTTKPDGSGLGIPIVLERVQNYRGKLLITSDEENGTVFKILLPYDGDRAAS